MSATIPGPAYRIQTQRLVVRCWDPRDVYLLQAAIEASLEHLWDWMPWAREEPQDLQKRIALMRRFRGDFDLGNDFVYGILNPQESQVWGGTGLHTRPGQDALEIGYWIHVDHINQGLATETAAALTQVAFEVHAVKRVEIHCDSDNVRSAAVPRKLGFVHEATLRRRDVTPGGEPRDTMIWTLLDDEYPASPAASAVIQAFDVLGRRIL